MTFSQALDLMKAGHSVARAEWTGEDMFLLLKQGMLIKSGSEYQPSQADLLASDWKLVMPPYTADLKDAE